MKYNEQCNIVVNDSICSVKGITYKDDDRFFIAKLSKNLYSLIDKKSGYPVCSATTLKGINNAYGIVASTYNGFIKSKGYQIILEEFNNLLKEKENEQIHK